MTYGNTSISASDLYFALDWLNAHGRSSHIAPFGDRFPDGSSVVVRASRNFWIIISIRNNIHFQTPRPFIKYLPFVRTFEASDLRDTVYGLLGLVTDVDDFGFEVIYSDEETLENVYIRLAIALIKCGYAYEVLLYASSKVSSIDVPSWVPDWSCQQTETLFVQINDEGNTFYHAGGIKKPSVVIMKNNRELAMRGSLVDNIHSLGDTIDSSSWKRGDGATHIRRWEARARMFIDSLSSYPTGESIYDVYRRVLVANQDNQDNHGNKASASYIKNHERMLMTFQLEEYGNS